MLCYRRCFSIYIYPVDLIPLYANRRHCQQGPVYNFCVTIAYLYSSITSMKKKENRSVRVSGRIKPSLEMRVDKLIEHLDWTLSDCIEIGLKRLCEHYDI